jgi:hypothetical protein
MLMEERRIQSLKELIGQLNLDQYKSAFKTREDCLEILAKSKWAEGFICRKCGNGNYCQGKSPSSRRCTRCKKEESATAHTIFHHCRIELPMAFEIAYRVCGLPSVPASELAQILDTRHMTCLNFKKRILHCLQTDGKLLIQE